jgi:hypothetical protein
MEDFISKEDFSDVEFDSLMSSIGKRRLWGTYKDDTPFFKVEFLPTGEVETFNNLEEAITAFNKLPI